MITNAGREALNGCDCTELCAMGPTCPGGMLAGLPDSGCFRTAADLPYIKAPPLPDDWSFPPYEEPRDDLAAIRVGDLPPWECCGRRGPHWPSCPNHPDTPEGLTRATTP